MKRLWVIAGVASGLVASAAVVLAANGGLHFSQEAAATAVTAPTAAKPVRVHRVTAVVPSVRTYTGVVKPRHESDLAFRVGGKVVARGVDVGERVIVGQVIARLDPTDYELAVRIAEADVTAARAEAGNAANEDERFRRLAPSGAATQSDLDRVKYGRLAAEARAERAQQALTLAQNRLSYCELRADADGVVTALPVEVGQVVSEGLLVARVARTGELEAVVNLPENRVEDASAAAHATIWAETGTGYVVKLRELSPTADPVTRTYQARFTVCDPGPDVTIGRTVTIQLGMAAAVTSVTVPLTALGQYEGQTSVWRVDGDRLVSVPVEVAGYRDDSVTIVSGVRPGDVVVAAGVQKLDAGLRVRAWEGQ